MKHKSKFDVIVVGGGHAGIEASLILNKLKKSVIIITMDEKALGRMSCNPAIGGLAKGQMVREIDMLGGQMGSFADASGIQFKTLNKKKGRAVWSPRAQVDKRHYERLVKNQLKKSSVQVLTGEAVSVLVSKYTACGVLLRSGEKILSNAVIVTAGTFLSGVVHIGNRKIQAGRMGEERSEGLTESLVSIGFKTARLKTGTPPRLNKNTIDWEKAIPTFGDKKPVPFSYFTKVFNPPNEACHIINTNHKVHEIIEKNKTLSPMFSGEIKGEGPRYCPSIEDKINRFSNRDSHLLFLESEWKNSDQIYLNGFSTSLPEKTQLSSLKKIPALRNVSFFRPGYAIEYDFFPPSQLKSSLESKDVSGLFFAGQMNGTSGYEEAAAQGLLSGINASLYNEGKKPLVLSRSSSYIGVMIDDLITKDTKEPYRMFTSRAEYRLLLRFSNTLDRLIEPAHQFNLLKTKQLSYLKTVLNEKSSTREKLKISIKPNQIKKTIKQALPANLFIKQNGVSIFDLPKKLLKPNKKTPAWLFEDMLFDLESEVKYEGYIKRHLREIEKLNKSEKLTLTKEINYVAISGLSSEAKEKLSFIRPENIGQAKRISGISQSDLFVLSVYLSKRVSRET